MNKPLVSIIIPTYNRSHLIGETLDSVIAQTYPNWECIVIDDDSIDYTEELMEFYCKMDSRIQYYQRPKDRPKGANACRNFGVSICKGDLIQFLDSDDLIAFNKFEEQIKVLKKNQADLATCKWGSFATSKNLRTKKKYYSFRNYASPWKLLRTFGRKSEYFPSHVYLLSKKLVEKADGWNEELLINQDGEYFVRIILNANKIVYCKRTAAYYRYGDEVRVSIIRNREELESALYSWDLIAHNINQKMKIKSLRSYINNGRKNVINNFKENLK